MTNLENYLQDGANYQARSILMFLQSTRIEESWNDETERYDAETKVARWENGREQGYIISLVIKDRKQLNIAFFEHRNCDDIYAIKWEQNSINTLTIDNAEFGDVYRSKYDKSYSVDYGKVCKMAKWINKQLLNHWLKK